MHDNLSKNRQYDFVDKPSGGPLAWLRAWYEVMRKPNGSIPEPHLPSEGEPVPPELGLCCPECGRSISGLCEPRCPGCGARFSLRRAYTIKMLKQPEYFLRYRFGPPDIRRIAYTVILMLSGVGLVMAASVNCTLTIAGVGDPWTVPLRLGLKGMVWVVGLSVPSLLLIKLAVDLSWVRVSYYYAIIWFVASVMLYAVVRR